MPTAKEVYAMLGNESLWQAANHCHELLREAQIPHLICGGVAVCLHGYQRNTTDIDLIVERDRASDVRAVLETAGFQWDAENKEFRTQGGIQVQFLIAGERAGRNSEVQLPVPSGELNVETIEGLPVLRLSRLIEIKIACGAENVRRMHKDFADVVELILVRGLDGSFARFLHSSVRDIYRRLVRNAHGEE